MPFNVVDFHLREARDAELAVRAPSKLKGPLDSGSVKSQSGYVDWPNEKSYTSLCHGGDLSWLQLKSTRKSPQCSKQSKLPLCCLIDLVITISSVKVGQSILDACFIPQEVRKRSLGKPLTNTIFKGTAEATPRL
jgi:hypothetical protein